MAEAATKRRRTEAEKAQEQYDLATRKVEKKAKQLETAQSEVDRLGDELHELEATQQFWGSHPLVKKGDASE